MGNAKSQLFRTEPNLFDFRFNVYFHDNGELRLEPSGESARNGLADTDRQHKKCRHAQMAITRL
jgi:hypothetical protein